MARLWFTNLFMVYGSWHKFDKAWQITKHTTSRKIISLTTFIYRSNIVKVVFFQANDVLNAVSSFLWLSAYNVYQTTYFNKYLIF